MVSTFFVQFVYCLWTLFIHIYMWLRVALLSCSFPWFIGSVLGEDNCIPIKFEFSSGTSREVKSICISRNYFELFFDWIHSLSGNSHALLCIRWWKWLHICWVCYSMHQTPYPVIYFHSFVPLTVLVYRNLWLWLNLSDTSLVGNAAVFNGPTLD